MVARGGVFGRPFCVLAVGNHHKPLALEGLVRMRAKRMFEYLLD